MRRTATGALEGSIRCDSNVAFFRKFLGIEASDLFLYATIRMGHDDGRIFLTTRLIIACRRIDISGNGIAVEVIVDEMDIYLTLSFFVIAP